MNIARLFHIIFSNKFSGIELITKIGVIDDEVRFGWVGLHFAAQGVDDPFQAIAGGGRVFLPQGFGDG